MTPQSKQVVFVAVPSCRQLKLPILNLHDEISQVPLSGHNIRNGWLSATAYVPWAWEVWERLGTQCNKGGGVELLWWNLVCPYLHLVKTTHSHPNLCWPQTLDSCNASPLSGHVAEAAITYLPPQLCCSHLAATLVMDMAVVTWHVLCTCEGLLGFWLLPAVVL